jgi:hypothetical protein
MVPSNWVKDIREVYTCLAIVARWRITLSVTPALPTREQRIRTPLLAVKFTEEDGKGLAVDTAAVCGTRGDGLNDERQRAFARRAGRFVFWILARLAAARQMPHNLRSKKLPACVKGCPMPALVGRRARRAGAQRAGVGQASGEETADCRDGRYMAMGI